MVWRESRSGEDDGEDSWAEVGGVSDDGVDGEVVGADESDVEDEASRVGRRKATRGIERSGAVTESEADWSVVEVIVTMLQKCAEGCR